MPFDERAKRASVPAEWRITAELVRDDGHVLENIGTLRISDARLNNEFADAARAIGLRLDEVARRRALRDKLKVKKTGQR